MDLDVTPPEKPTSHLPPIWLTILIAVIILLSIFIPYRKKLHQYSIPVIQAIQQIAQSVD